MNAGTNRAVAAVYDRRNDAGATDQNRRSEPVAAVYDRRSDPGATDQNRRSEPVAAVYDRRSDAGAADQNRRSEPVAAVYDRRQNSEDSRDRFGGHRPPLQVPDALAKAGPAMLRSVDRDRPVLPTTPQRKPRLSRLQKTFFKVPVYFITLCTHERQKLLASPSAHETFRVFCRSAAAHGVCVGRYVLMPDHIHLFVAIAATGPEVSLWLKSLKNYLSKTLRAAGCPAPLWQKGFFDHVMRSADSYAEKWEYVLAIPVRAGLVASVEQWPYQGEINDLRF